MESHTPPGGPQEVSGDHLSHEEEMMIILMIMALAQIPISTFSHIWIFVRQYGVMFVIIVIVIIIIIIYRKVKVSTLKHV